LSPKIADENITGKYFVSSSKVRAPSAEAQDEVIGKKLWLVSEKWTRLHNANQ